MGLESIYIIIFLVVMAGILAVDLMIGKGDHGQISFKDASIMSVIVILLSLGLFALISNYGHHLHGITNIHQLQEVMAKYHQSGKIIPGDYETSLDLYNKNLGVEYITGFVLEYALSVDNIFVILLIFSGFQVKPSSYHKVLIYGILGAIALRFLFIFMGAALISRFEWILYVFGIFLVYTGIKMFLERNSTEEIDGKTHPIVKLAGRFFPLYPNYVGNRFFVVEQGKRMMTPLFLVLLVVEFTDIIFAVDSIPAVFSVTKDPYIVFFSNIFAVVGLRSMFFMLAGIVEKFRYLKVGLSLLLVFIGLKMLFEKQLHDWGFTTIDSLLVIISILGISIVASLLIPDVKKNRKIRADGQDPTRLNRKQDSSDSAD